MKNSNREELITEHTFEIQHEASGKLLDVKGSLADYIRTSGIFPDWQIDTTGVRFFDTKTHQKKEKDAIVGYNIIRISIYDPKTKNYFEETATKFFNKVQKNTVGYTIPTIKRVGVRTKCFIPCDSEFKTLNKKIFDLFYKEEILGLLGGTKTDCQAIIELKEKDLQIKICLGPVKSNEAKNYFSFANDNFSKTGIYIDIDCFKLDNYKNIKEAMEITWNKIAILLDKLGV